jgi:hypothetical protein
VHTAQANIDRDAQHAKQYLNIDGTLNAIFFSNTSSLASRLGRYGAEFSGFTTAVDNIEKMKLPAATPAVINPVTSPLFYGNHS